MEEKLYGSQGYYSTGNGRSGRAGDYFTAPEVGGIFGRLVAALLAEWTAAFAVRPFHWVEVGAGEGVLARSIGAAIASDHKALAQQIVYSAVERGQERRAHLGMAAAQMPCKFQVLADLKPLRESPVTGCFFANELIDAFPVHRVRMSEGRLQEAYVEGREGPRHFVWGTPSTPALQRYFERAKVELPEGYETEVNLAMASWLKEVSQALTAGIVVLIDYGRSAADYYHPDRRGGTLRGFRSHEVRRDVLAPEIMDVTADVDFTSLSLDAEEAGLTPLAFMDLGSFLVRGARYLHAEKLAAAEPTPQAPGAVLSREWAGLRYLVHPEGMGSAFQVLLLGKGIDPADWTFEHNRIGRLKIQANRE